LAEKGTPDSDKKATEISYAYFIQFILYKNLVDNCFGKFNEEFDIRISNIYNCLKNKAYQGITSQIYGISHFISDKLYKPFNKEQEFINQKLHEVLCKADVMLEEVTLWLDIVVFIKKYNFANLKNEIFGFIYENYLKELYEETNKGQYFTDPAVVNFMLDEIGYTPKEIQKLYDKKELDKLSIIDPSCGSGTFLYSAVHRIVETLFDGSEDKSKIIEEIVNNNIFGLDIAEFPLYLAEMNILMRLLPIIVNENYNNPIDKKIKIFKTQDSISEFMDTGIKANSETFENEVIQGTQQKSLFQSQILDLSYKAIFVMKMI
jgi:type I restriction-modification system DNA methylase subunit